MRFCRRWILCAPDNMECFESGWSNRDGKMCRGLETAIKWGVVTGLCYAAHLFWCSQIHMQIAFRHWTRCIMCQSPFYWWSDHRPKRLPYMNLIYSIWGFASPYVGKQINEQDGRLNPTVVLNLCLYCGSSCFDCHAVIFLHTDVNVTTCTCLWDRDPSLCMSLW